MLFLEPHEFSVIGADKNKPRLINKALFKF